MTDVVDTIADRVVTLLDGASAAGVHRDRDVALDDSADLPAVDVRVGAEEPEDSQTGDTYQGVVTISVDLYVADAGGKVSSDLLALREEVHAALMVAPYKLGLGSPVRLVRPAGASEVITFSRGQVPIGYLSTQWRVQFSLDLDSRSTET